MKNFPELLRKRRADIARLSGKNVRELQARERFELAGLGAEFHGLYPR
jgi:hypothetical protein